MKRSVPLTDHSPTAANSRAPNSHQEGVEAHRWVLDVRVGDTATAGHRISVKLVKEGVPVQSAERMYTGSMASRAAATLRLGLSLLSPCLEGYTPGETVLIRVDNKKLFENLEATTTRTGSGKGSMEAAEYISRVKAAGFSLAYKFVKSSSPCSLPVYEAQASSSPSCFSAAAAAASGGGEKEASRWVSNPVTAVSEAQKVWKLIEDVFSDSEMPEPGGAFWEKFPHSQNFRTVVELFYTIVALLKVRKLWRRDGTEPPPLRQKLTHAPERVQALLPVTMSDPEAFLSAFFGEAATTAQKHVRFTSCVLWTMQPGLLSEHELHQVAYTVALTQALSLDLTQTIERYLMRIAHGVQHCDETPSHLMLLFEECFMMTIALFVLVQRSNGADTMWQLPRCSSCFSDDVRRLVEQKHLTNEKTRLQTAETPEEVAALTAVAAQAEALIRTVRLEKEEMDVDSVTCLSSLPCYDGKRKYELPKWEQNKRCGQRIRALSHFTYYIYTDGSCSENTKCGAGAAVLYKNGAWWGCTTIAGRFRDCGKAESQGMLAALRMVMYMHEAGAIQEGATVAVLTDRQTLVRSIEKGLSESRDGKEVEETILRGICERITALKEKNVKCLVCFIYGHCTFFNEVADRKANEARTEFENGYGKK